MRNDLHQTFGEIFNGDPSAFRKQLLEVQPFTTDRSKAEKWAKKLRFLDISEIPDLQAEKQKRDCRYALAKARGYFYERKIPSREVPITEREEDDEDAYIAVSWRWAHFDEPEPPVFDYRIRRPHAKRHKSDFPDRYMDRVIQFAQSVNVSKLWIDKECIYQRSGDERKWPKDKELGVQIMDLVYGDSEVSVGLLTVKLTRQHQVDLLSELLQGRIFVDPKDRENPKLRPEVNVLAVQKLIRRILSDPRWDRGWIFQEDHLASNRMTLLIPCSASVRKDQGYDFGDILGDLKVKLKDLRQNATMFCLARPEERRSNTDILEKLKQYNICNKSYTPPQDDHLLRSGRNGIRGNTGDDKNYQRGSSYEIPAYRTTTNCVLDDICSRSLENEEDRIAILANALRFTTRIDIGKGSPIHKPDKYSLSVALLALILMNGEILKSTTWGSPDRARLPCESNLMQHTLQSYLAACQHEFSVPNLRFQQTFVDHCRLKSPTITSRGLQTEGWLFELFPRERSRIRADQLSLRLTDSDREALSDLGRGPVLRGTKLDEDAHTALDALIQKLEALWPGSKLASYMRRQLFFDEHLSRSDLPPSAPRRGKEEEEEEGWWQLFMKFRLCDTFDFVHRSLYDHANKKRTSVSLASSQPSKNQHQSLNQSMSSQTKKLVLKLSLTPLTYLFTRANSLFQSQRRAWKDFADSAPDPALVNLINGPMKDTGRLLNMTQKFLRKLIDLAEIKLKQVETEAQIAGAEWLANPTDPMNNAKFLMARKIHSDYFKHMREAWDVGLKIIPGIQARFDDMEDTLEKLAVLIPIEELALPLGPFVVKGLEVNDRMWVFAIRLLGIVRTVDTPLGVATVAVNVEKYPEADKLARARYKFGDY
ncbi:uncharacterized protein J4E78_004713 [Alternaria triticimaculans]|uniref:uncharacterized protein n=1 Tax=Alternaria triticimaculans TaxID=297637 RepID=UPI0020C52C24|nr:uncharacterized protein J4E78_004713 [Alternaria triticimaculans]KAI4661923.1 hypothetical protein J4E78_004713 [Alternaria triticimaculans]